MKQETRLPLFRSPEQERLLAELFIFAEGPISLSELASRASTSLGGAHKEVERLEASGLVTSTKVGRTRLIEPDPMSPVFDELRGLLVKTIGPEPLLRSALADIEGIEDAFIYGSWANPNERNPADIDVLVIGDLNVGAVYDAASTVEAVVGRPVNVTVRSHEEWTNAQGEFEKAVKAAPRVDLI